MFNRNIYTLNVFILFLIKFSTSANTYYYHFVATRCLVFLSKSARRRMCGALWSGACVFREVCVCVCVCFACSVKSLDCSGLSEFGSTLPYSSYIGSSSSCLPNIAESPLNAQTKHTHSHSHIHHININIFGKKLPFLVIPPPPTPSVHTRPAEVNGKFWIFFPTKDATPIANTPNTQNNNIIQCMHSVICIYIYMHICCHILTHSRID